MNVLSFDLDSAGRPIVDLFAAVSSNRIVALHAVGETSPRPVAIRALVDTGASQSNVDRSIIKKLDLDPVGEKSVHTASTGSTPRLAQEYNIQLFFSGLPVGLISEDLPVLEAEDLSGLDIDMLLGRDVLKRWLLIFSGLERRFTIAFGEPATGP